MAIAAEAIALVPLVELGLRCVEIERLVARFSTIHRPRRAIDILRAARVVDAALDVYPAATCLKKSLVLMRILRRRGHEATVHLGVQKSADRFRAHAWVECDGRVLLDAGIVDGYAPMGRLPQVARATIASTNRAASSSDVTTAG